MPTLPWTATHRADNVTNVVVMASTLRLTSFRKVPGFLLAAMKVRRQVLAAPGAVGVSLKTRLPRKTFYTLSSWQSQSALDDFVRGEPHRSTMSRYHPEMAESKFEFGLNPPVIHLPGGRRWSCSAPDLSGSTSHPTDSAGADGTLASLS